jgi:hypothetical protein
MRPRTLALLVFILAGQAAGQVRVNFFQQPEVRIGPYVMYAAQACNGANTPATIRGGNIWDQAKERGQFTPQLTSAVLAEKDLGTKTSKKAWALRIASWSAAGGTALTGGRVLGNLSLEAGPGRAVMIVGPLVAGVAGLAAEHIAQVPERDIDPRIDAILPGTIELAPRDCSPQYVIWGIPREVQGNGTISNR